MEVDGSHSEFDDYFLVYLRNADLPAEDCRGRWFKQEMTTVLQSHERKFRSPADQKDTFSVGAVAFVKNEPTETLHETMVGESTDDWCQVVEQLIEELDMRQLNLELSANLVTGNVRVSMVSPNVLGPTFEILEPVVCSTSHVFFFVV